MPIAYQKIFIFNLGVIIKLKIDCLSSEGKFCGCQEKTQRMYQHATQQLTKRFILSDFRICFEQFSRCFVNIVLNLDGGTNSPTLEMIIPTMNP